MEGAREMGNKEWKVPHMGVGRTKDDRRWEEADIRVSRRDQE